MRYIYSRLAAEGSHAEPQYRYQPDHNQKYKEDISEHIKQFLSEFQKSVSVIGSANPNFFFFDSIISNISHYLKSSSLSPFMVRVYVIRVNTAQITNTTIPITEAIL